MHRPTTPFLPVVVALASLLLCSPGLAQSAPDAAERESPAQGVAPPAQPLPPPPTPPAGAAPAWMEPNPYAAVPSASWTGPLSPPAADRGPDVPQLTKSRWYGWQTLLTDAAAFASLDIDPALGVGVYALGGPIVHWSHGNTWRGFGSLAMRVGAPVLLGAAFARTCNPSGDEGDWGCLGAAVIGVGLGVAGAIAVDAAVLARDRVPVESDTAMSLGSVSVTPTLAAGRDRASLMLQGTF